MPALYGVIPTIPKRVGCGRRSRRKVWEGMWRQRGEGSWRGRERNVGGVRREALEMGGKRWRGEAGSVGGEGSKALERRGRER